MTSNTSYLLVAGAVVLAFATARILLGRLNDRSKAWMPRELRNAELVYAEKTFSSGGDTPIVAKCDRGYRTKKGVVVLVELKTRKLNRVYPSDIIELSAQRYAIQLQTYDNVADHGYVLIRRVSTNKCHLHQVKLMDLGDVAALAYRRRAIIIGAAVSNCALTRGLCLSCSFVNECKSMKNPLD